MNIILLNQSIDNFFKLFEKTDYLMKSIETSNKANRFIKFFQLDISKPFFVSMFNVYIF